MRKSKRSEIRNAKKALELLDVFFADTSVSIEQHEYLWNVLAALRGPDAQHSYTLKHDTTEVIRTAAFPRTEAVAIDTYIPANFAMPDRQLNEEALAAIEVSSHFARHIRVAAGALRSMNKLQANGFVTRKARSK